jgi:hypothetical protein
MAFSSGVLINLQDRADEHVPRDHHERGMSVPGGPTGLHPVVHPGPLPVSTFRRIQTSPATGGSPPGRGPRHSGGQRDTHGQAPLVPQSLVDLRHPHSGRQLLRDVTLALSSPTRSPATARYGTVPEPLPDRPLPLKRRLAGPPGTTPAATVGATYTQIVLWSAPRRQDISASGLPACQRTRISVTTNILLAMDSVLNGRQGCFLSISRSTTTRA